MNQSLNQGLSTSQSELKQLDEDHQSSGQEQSQDDPKETSQIEVSGVNNNSYLRKEKSQLEPIKITFGSSDGIQFEPYYQDAISESISEIQQFIYMYPLTGQHQIKESELEQTFGFNCRIREESHLHITVGFIKGDPLRHLRWSSFAGAEICAQNLEGRPISGNIFMNTLKFPRNNQTLAKSIIKHEIMHVIGFIENTSYERIKDKLSYDNQTVESGYMRDYLISQNIERRRRTSLFQFGGIIHFDQQFKECGEIMIPKLSRDYKLQLTKLTGMYLKDLGLYDEIKIDQLPDLKCPPK